LKSTCGYIFTLSGVVTSLKFSEQTYIVKSMMKSKFISLDKTGEEVE